MDAYIGRGNSYMEYGHDEGIKQAQKDFLKALHYNPICTKARISLGYNLQVMLHKTLWAMEVLPVGRGPPFCQLLVGVSFLQYPEKKDFLRLARRTSNFLFAWN